LEAFLDTVTAWSWLVYIVLFLVLVVESAGAPIPGLSVALGAAAMAGQGRLEFWLVYLSIVAGGAAGGVIGYAVGRQGGRQVLERYGRYILLTPERLEAGERGFQRQGSKIVILGRYLPFFCFFASIISGMARMPYHRFFILNLLGIILWSTTQLSLAFIFGRSLDVLIQTFNNIGLALVVAGIIVGSGVYWRRWRRRILQSKALAEPIPVRSQD
jgi:membrane protein DedA with SNARE-associated domain